MQVKDAFCPQLEYWAEYISPSFFSLEKLLFFTRKKLFPKMFSSSSQRSLGSHVSLSESVACTPRYFFYGPPLVDMSLWKENFSDRTKTRNVPF